MTGEVQGLLIPVGQTQLTRDDYYTPREVFDALGLRFDLDVCAPPGGVPWVPADRYFTHEDDGLSQPWAGRVWMNPPYSQATPWVRRFIEHRHGIALLGHAKSAWHAELWAKADGCATPPPLLRLHRWVDPARHLLRGLRRRVRGSPPPRRRRAREGRAVRPATPPQEAPGAP